MILADNQDVKIERREVPENHQLSLLSEIYVERGTIEDWNLLHELHYKAENLGIGPVFYRCVLRGKTIGVGVMTVPKMLLRGRNKLFKYLAPNKIDGKDTKVVNTHRAKWLNKNVCTNSRLVLDTTYRGAGIAYRMQNLMMRMSGARYVEFQSSMSKFNPFAAKAGIQFTAPERSAFYEKGMEFFRRWFEAIPTDFVGVYAELMQMRPGAQARCIQEMREFYYKCSSMEKSGDNRMNGMTRINALSPQKLIKNLQQLIFASPLHGVYANPDHDQPLPARIYLTEFDNQAPDEKLNLSRCRLCE